MQKIKFAYNEPRLGDIEITGEGWDRFGEEEILKLIEEEYPEAIDIEIIESEEVNG